MDSLTNCSLFWVNKEAKKALPKGMAGMERDGLLRGGGLQGEDLSSSISNIDCFRKNLSNIYTAFQMDRCVGCNMLKIKNMGGIFGGAARKGKLWGHSEDERDFRACWELSST